MAVKQNNTDKNEDKNGTVNGLTGGGKQKSKKQNDDSMMGSSVVGGGGVGDSGGGGGGGKNGSIAANGGQKIYLVSVSGNACNLGGKGIHQYNMKSNGKQMQYPQQQYAQNTIDSTNVNETSNMNYNFGCKRTDINFILNIIEKLEMRQPQIHLMQDVPKIYFQLIQGLAKVQVPFQSAEELKYFKEDIARVRAFFAKPNDKVVYNYYLYVVCQLLTANIDGKPPSCALAIIFQLFSTDMIYDAVHNLLQHEIPDVNIKRTITLLCEWLSICNFCQNLNIWIVEILDGLRQLKKFTLYDQIALDNIDKLFAKLMLPAFRPKVAPVIMHMLFNVAQTPNVFHKILPQFPRVVNQLKQQSVNTLAEDCDGSTKHILKQLLEVANALMTRFYGYDDLYEPIENCLKEIQTSMFYSEQDDIGGRDDEIISSMSPNSDEISNRSLVLSPASNAKVGLVNLGNTCYMNSVLQALVMTKEFSREILLLKSKSPLIIKMQHQIALMLYSIRHELTPSKLLNATRPPGFTQGVQQDSSEFLGHLLEALHSHELQYMKQNKFLTTTSATSLMLSGNGEKSSSSETIPNVSKLLNERNACFERGPQFNGVKIEECEYYLKNKSSKYWKEIMNMDNEDDNDEYFEEKMYDNDEEEDHRAYELKNKRESFKEDQVEEEEITNNKNYYQLEKFNSKPISTIDKTFTGLLTTTYKCLTCGWKSRNMDSFRDLQLSFPDVENDCASNYSVQDLIEYYCSPEKLDGENQYFCDRCKKLSDAERYINVVEAPKNMILTLKHFKYDQKHHMRAKLMHKVFHDEKVSVKICCPKTLKEVATVHYDLYAGVVHSGFSMDSGHYYTYASDSYNNWYKFNDDIVTPSKTEELHNLAPPNTLYILFYQMGGRSNETPLESATLASTAKVIKIDVPTPLALEELPSPLKDLVLHDNYAFREELRLRRHKNATLNAIHQGESENNSTNRGCDHYFDEDEDEPPPVGGGCGSNMLNINTNRFIC